MGDRGTGQGIVNSDEMCRDQACLVFKHVEGKNIRAKFNSPEIEIEIKKQHLVIVFVDDTEFHSNG